MIFLFDYQLFILLEIHNRHLIWVFGNNKSKQVKNVLLPKPDWVGNGPKLKAEIPPVRIAAVIGAIDRL
jgi:hypothetical protein